MVKDTIKSRVMAIGIQVQNASSVIREGGGAATIGGYVIARRLANEYLDV